ncbi:SGNH/GDSL hydrolase family protein [Amycolatopsis sp. H20-H5]|uniref:SGNH/GDSL hydrolase family protein n=1 Tax=Amycolatopsis sp. H20-H5 TaxID=3046309 RepID=UPI002DBA7C3B|nr:SGNH/GDSL hydrolase family protein [Amycolatopsis sp. H20-H5]MEC3979179.1 SGNH/GDSL hydrolase family protein [Amycolatopsis sp. H20-H5]
MQLSAKRTWFTALAVSTMLAGSAVTASAAESPGGYVALGDSAAAGPLILPADTSSLGCLRSLADYPHVVAKQTGAALTDVTCSSATTADFTGRQQTFTGPVAPQLDAVDTRAKTVTLTIGANDVGLVSAVLTCLNPLPGVIPSCANRFTAGGHDQLAEKIDAFAPKWGELLDQIAARAPEADVYVVGYGTYLPHNGCWPIVPLSAKDANYVQGTIGHLDEALAGQAQAHGAKFLDIRPVSVGHDACRPPSSKWFEGLIPTAIAAPLHPNKAGMAGIGTYLATTITT